MQKKKKKKTVTVGHLIEAMSIAFAEHRLIKRQEALAKMLPSGVSLEYFSAGPTLYETLFTYAARDRDRYCRSGGEFRFGERFKESMLSTDAKKFVEQFGCEVGSEGSGNYDAM